MLGNYKFINTHNSIFYLGIGILTVKYFDIGTIFILLNWVHLRVYSICYKNILLTLI